MWKTIKINLGYIKAVNSCTVTIIAEYMLNVCNDVPIPQVFRSKRYFWNINRSKDFYKSMTQLVTLLLEYDTTTKRALQIYNEVVATARTDEHRKAFTKAVLKHVQFLTLTSVRYMSKQRLEQLLLAHNTIRYIEPCIMPFIERISHLEDEVDSLTDMI